MSSGPQYSAQRGSSMRDFVGHVRRHLSRRDVPEHRYHDVVDELASELEARYTYLGGHAAIVVSVNVMLFHPLRTPEPDRVLLMANQYPLVEARRGTLSS